MAITPTILIEQATLGAGSAGASRADGVVSQEVTLTDPANPGVQAGRLWEVFDTDGTAVALSDNAAEAPTFTPTASGYGTFTVFVSYGDGTQSWVDGANGERIQLNQGGFGVAQPVLGNIMPGAGETTQFGAAGYAAKANAILRPIDGRLPTADEKGALAGTGTPSAGNAFVTDDDARLSDTRAADAIITTTGPTTMSVGAVADGEYLLRSGASIVGGTPVGGGGGGLNVPGLEFLDRIEVTGAAVQTLTFGAAGDGENLHNVDGNTDEHYVIVARIVNANTPGVMSAEMRPNGTATSDRNSQKLTSSSTSTASSDESSTLRIADFSFNEMQTTIDFRVKNGRAKVYTSLGATIKLPTEDAAIHNYGGVWGDAATNLTSIELFASTGTHFGVGTEFLLYRRNRVAAPSVSAAAKSNIWYPPEAPHTHDEEFDSVPLPAGWVESFTPSGIIDAYDTGFTTGVPRRAIHTDARRSWYMVQSPANNTPFTLSKDITSLPTNFLMHARCSMSMNGGGSQNNDGSLSVFMAEDNAGSPDSDQNEILMCVNEQDNNVQQAELFKWVGGVFTSGGVSANEASRIPRFNHVALHKIGNVYHGWVGTDFGTWLYVGSLTQAFTHAHVGIKFLNASTAPTAPGVRTVGVDFMRFYETDKFLL